MSHAESYKQENTMLHNYDPMNAQDPTRRREFPTDDDTDAPRPAIYTQAELDAAVEQARRECDVRARKLNEYFCYWLLRAYQSGHREGWEEGPSVAQTMTDLLHVLANSGFDPSSAVAKELLKKKMAYFL